MVIRELIPKVLSSFCRCQYTRGSVFKFAQFAPGACSQIFNGLNIVGGNSAPGNEVYPWTRWYTRRSFSPRAFPWSMLQKQNPSCLSALISTCVALWQKTRWCNVLVLIAVSNYILAYSLASTSLGTMFRILQNLGKKRGVNDCHHRWKFWWSRPIVTPTLRTKNTISTALLYF